MDSGSSRYMDWALRFLLQVLAWLGPVAGKLLDRLVERFLSPQDAYEVEDYKVTLDVLDPEGRRAIHVKRERVRFLRDHVTAIYDYGW